MRRRELMVDVYKRQVHGSAVEIKSGLTEDDRIAFPYGKNAVEGAAVTDESSNY